MPRIDIAWFECIKCGCRCTPLESINSIPHEMEEYQTIKENIDFPKKKLELEKKHKGNKFKIEGNKIKVERYYTKVLFQSDTLLENSKEIILGCPECNQELYRVKW